MTRLIGLMISFLSISTIAMHNKPKSPTKTLPPKSKKNRKIVETIRLDPNEIAERNRAAREKIGQEIAQSLSIKNEQITSAVLNDYFYKNPLILKKKPLLLLDECGNQKCDFNRTKYPLRRKICAERVAQMLVEKIKRKDPLICLNLLGEPFHDATILTQTLYQHPTAHIEWHSIGSVKNLTTNKPNIWNMGSRIVRQQTNFFKKSFPYATIIFRQYPTVSEYCKALSTGTVKPADIVHGLNLSDEIQEWYYLLCAQTLEKNTASKNILFLTENIHPQKSAESIQLTSHSYTPNPTDDWTTEHTIIYHNYNYVLYETKSILPL